MKRCALCKHYTEDLSVPDKKKSTLIKAQRYNGWCRKLQIPTDRTRLRCGGDDFEPLPVIV